MYPTGTRRYFTFLLLVVLILGAATVLAVNSLGQMTHSAARINLAGKQRMLFQRSLLLADRMHAAEDADIRNAARQDLVVVLDGLLVTHADLWHGRPQAGLPATTDEEIISLIVGPAAYLDRDLKAYVDIQTQHMQGPIHDPDDHTHGHMDPKRKLASSETALAQLLDEVVSAYESQYLQHLDRLIIVVAAAGLLILVSVITASVTLVRPVIVALSRQTSHLTAVLDNMADGLITINEDGVIDGFNPAAEKIFGYEKSDVMGRNVAILLPDNEQAAHKDYVRQSNLYASRIINKSRDLWGRRQDGSLFPMELNVARLPSVEGGSSFVGIFRDISDRKEAEQRLIDARQRAESAREEAEIANRAKSKFLSSMSHELRTPMNAILGFGQLLAADTNPPLAEKHKPYIQYILGSGEHLLNLIREILDLAAIESGKFKIDLAVLEPSPIVNGVIQMAEVHARKFGVTVENTCEPKELPPILADRMRVNQILLNLLTNGIKFNRKGGLVTISCEIIEGHFLRFLVTDDGPGIAQDKLPGLFVPFNRLGAETSGIEGSGIGLVIVKELVQMMGGHLGFETVPDQGSVFWFEMPLAKADPVDQVHAENADSDIAENSG